MKKLLVLIIITLTTFSCESDDSNPSSNPVVGASGRVISSEDCNAVDSMLLSLSEEQKQTLLSKNNRELTELILVEVNNYRETKNLSSLQANENLLLLGVLHNEYQIENNTISHDQAMDRFCSISQVNNVFAFAENTAFGYDTAKEVVEALLLSPNHKKNIEGDFDITATSAVINEKGTIFYTQIFAKL